MSGEDSPSSVTIVSLMLPWAFMVNILQWLWRVLS